MPVYMIRAGVIGPVKIGHATNVVERLRSIVPPSPAYLWIMRVFDGARPEEKMLHARFAHLRLKGEWFNYDVSLRQELPLHELPVPHVKRHRWGTARPDNPRTVEEFFHHDVLGLIGGENGLAEAVGIDNALTSYPHLIRPELRSAAIVLLRQHGRTDITLRTFEAFEAATKAADDAIAEEKKQKNAAKIHRLDPLQVAREWIQRMGAVPTHYVPAPPRAKAAA